MTRISFRLARTCLGVGLVCSAGALAQQASEKQQEAKASPGKPAEAAKSPAFDPLWLKGLKWRSIGPAAMGGRIVDLMINPQDPSTYYVITATGGIFKTV